MAGVLQNILRAFVRKELVTLSEEAIAPSAAANKGLALLAPSDGLGSYVLYELDVAVRTLLELPGETSGTLAKELINTGAVVAMLHVEKSAKCWEARAVTASAAVKGYGPLLYDVAMSDGPLVADRNSVSLSAERVWRRYYEREDVEKRPIDASCKKHVKVRPWLNFVYTLRSPVDTARLRRRHEAGVEELKHDFSRADVEWALFGAADRYFDSRYREA